MEKTKQSKVLYLDVLRAMACIIVVMFHSKGIYSDNVYSANFWASNIFEAFARIGVPLFVMISGALMLNEDYVSTPQKLKKHIMKMVFFFIIWSALYCVKFIFNGALNIWGILTDFIKGPYHLWFVPMIIGLYLIVPLLRLWVKKENKKHVEYFLILSLLFASLVPNMIGHLSAISPAFEIFNSLLSNLGISYVLGHTGYFILGWYLSTFEIKRKNTIIILGGIGVFVTFFGTCVLSMIKGEYYTLSGNFRLGVILYAVGVFVFIKEIFQNKNYGDKKAYSFVNLLCSCSLGIYAIHAAIQPLARQYINFESAFLQIPIEFTITLVVSFGLAWIIRQIPILKKII
ncbi:MAG: acyltransferase family protein [Clostridia bacterium]|nr:acyltransferase family protein [Clostridia bacterium]